MKPRRLPEFHENDITRFWSKVDQRRVKECWSWTSAVRPDGRGKFTVTGESFKRTLLAPRIAYALHYECDPYPDDVLHNCNNANCVNPHHLRLGGGDDIDNCADSIAAGTCAHGEGVHLAKLTNVGVREIKIALMNGERICDLAKRFNVHTDTIGRIKCEKTWKHIKVPGFLPQQRKLLSEIEVKAIKIALINGERICDLVKRLNIHHATISSIKHGRTWKHVSV